MPAIDLARLKKQTAHLADLFDQPSAFLREHRETWQYAMALSTQSQLDMLADRNDLAIPRALEAMVRAEALERWDIYLHALTNATTARCSSNVEVEYRGQSWRGRGVSTDTVEATVMAILDAVNRIALAEKAKAGALAGA